MLVDLQVAITELDLNCKFHRIIILCLLLCIVIRPHRPHPFARHQEPCHLQHLPFYFHSSLHFLAAFVKPSRPIQLYWHFRLFLYAVLLS